MSSGSQSALFLDELFQTLNKNHIVYCILRNYDELPERVGNDIDIWISKNYQQEFRAVVINVANKLEWEVIQHPIEYSPRLGSSGEGNYFLLKNSDGLNAIHLDCWTFINWKGLTFVDEEKFPQNLVRHEKKFLIPSPGIEASVLLLKEFLYHGRAPEKYKSRIQRLAKDDSRSFFEVLVKPFGFKNATSIVNMAKDGNWRELEQNSRYLRWVLIRHALIKKPLIQMRHWMTYLLGQLRKYLLSRSGTFLVLIGPDGSGKSTTASFLLNSEIKKLFQRRIYFHGHFSHLPELKKIASIFLKGRQRTAVESDPLKAQSKSFGMLRAMLYPFYYGMDYFLGHFSIWKEKARGGLIVFDRYFYDYRLQKPYENCPRWLINFVEKIIPEPDILIYLRNKPETIHERKQELTVEEIARQAGICNEIAKRAKNAFVIETSANPDEIVREIQRVIVDQIRQKARRM